MVPLALLLDLSVILLVRLDNRYVMVEFDDPNDGKKHRLSLRDDIKRRYTGKIVTQIERREEHFSFSKDRDYASSGGVAVNFPLKLCFAATGHKVQGYTVKSPSALKIDLAGVDGKTSRFCPPAIVYVMLSRVQRQGQLFILDGLPLWWIVAKGPGAVGFGVMVLALQRKISHDSVSSPT